MDKKANSDKEEASIQITDNQVHQKIMMEKVGRIQMDIKEEIKDNLTMHKVEVDKTTIQITIRTITVAEEVDTQTPENINQDIKCNLILVEFIQKECCHTQLRRDSIIS